MTLKSKSYPTDLKWHSVNLCPSEMMEKLLFLSENCWISITVSLHRWILKSWDKDNKGYQQN